jgi:type II secretory pathway component GspD/PulD (secretin)
VETLPAESPDEDELPTTPPRPTLPSPRPYAEPTLDALWDAGETIATPAGAGTMTMHLDNIDIRQVLDQISRSYGRNILVAPDVTGMVTANFEGVSCDEAIRGILKLCGLVSRQEGDLLFVYTAEKFPKEDLELRLFRLDFASGEDLLPGVQALLSDAGQAFVSTVDSKNNRRTQEAIVVTDAPDSLGRIEQYVLQADLPPRQVLIEAYVLEIELSEDARHGINYRHLFGNDISLDMTGFANPTAAPALFARIHSGQIDALLECLRTTNDAKTLASPRLMVVNGQTARLQVGEQLGYKVVTVTETSAMEDVRFLDVGVILEVTPQISRDNRVLMRVSPKVSDGRVNPDTLLPEEQTRQVDTDVLLQDGQGVVIGGLIQEKCEDLQKKVFFLGDLWLIGRLFQRREASKERTEIVVTLLPRIVDVDTFAEDPNMVDAQRCQTPIFTGALEEFPRPEPCMHDAFHRPFRPGQRWFGGDGFRWTE